MNRFLPTILFLFFLHLTLAQPFTIDSSGQSLVLPGNDLFPEWSADGRQLLFQSDRHGNWDIFLYDLIADTLFQLTDETSNERHPVWLPGENRIVFDSDREGARFLYKMELTTEQQELLFHRGIECRQASFPPIKRLVYFSGYDRQAGEWAIYSYDFVSDNLNKLTNLKGDCLLPAVSPNGKQILFQKVADTYPFERLAILNWYGKPEVGMDSVWAADPSWGPDGLKIYFVSGNKKLPGEVFSLWKDGTHLERLTNNNLKVRTPAVSPDGRKIALAVMQENGYDIFIIPLSE